MHYCYYYLLITYVLLFSVLMVFAACCVPSSQRVPLLYFDLLSQNDLFYRLFCNVIARLFCLSIGLWFLSLIHFIAIPVHLYQIKQIYTLPHFYVCLNDNFLFQNDSTKHISY